MPIQIRPIQPGDNPAVESIVKTVLKEHGCVGPGWASGDPELTRMFETYTQPGSGYWVVESTETGFVLGGGGYGPLKGSRPESKICEVQKLYFLPEARGHGLGRRLLETILDAATQEGYRTIYLESVPQLAQAVGLYQRLGFKSLDCHLGNTGHQHNCSVYMMRPLGDEAPADLPKESEPTAV